jgi:transposase
MDVKLEQRANTKFCAKLGKSGAETFQMIRRAYGNEAMSRVMCFEWHTCFKRGRTSLEDDESSGRPATSSTPKNVETIRRLAHEDRRRTIKNIAAIVNVSYGTVQTILTCDLNTHRVAAKFVPRLLTPEQKEHPVAICQELRQRAVDDQSFMSRVITGDESWVYGYNPETKQQSSQWKSPGSPRPKKARQSRSTTKNMLVAFFDIRGIVHHTFVPEGQTVNAEFYCNVLRRLRVDIRQKRPELWCADN